MDNNEQIIEQYRVGDGEVQLYLFLAHPILRHRFIEISAMHPRPPQEHRRARPLRRWMEQLGHYFAI